MFCVIAASLAVVAASVLFFALGFFKGWDAGASEMEQLWYSHGVSRRRNNP